MAISTTCSLGAFVNASVTALDAVLAAFSGVDCVTAAATSFAAAFAVV